MGNRGNRKFDMFQEMACEKHPYHRIGRTNDLFFISNGKKKFDEVSK